MHAVQTRDDDRARQIEALIPRVRRIAGAAATRELPPHMDQEDLVSEGFLGLMDAATRYRPESGVPFDAYATLRIRGAIVDALRRGSVASRAELTTRRRLEAARGALVAALGRAPSQAELAREAGMDLEALDAHLRAMQASRSRSLDAPAREGSETLRVALLPGSGPDPEALVMRRRRRARLRRAVDRLPRQERAAVRMRFLEARSHVEIGEAMGFTAGRSCQLCKRGLTRLKRRSAVA